MKIPMQIIFIGIIQLILSCKPGPKDHVKLEDCPEKVEVFGPDFISTGMYERDIAISPEGDEIIFTLSNYKQTKRCLVSIKRTTGIWGEKRILSFSGQHEDIEPFFSPDGQKLLFVSNRPIFSDTTRNDYNIWISEKGGDIWQNPKPLSELINTDSDEFYPSMGSTSNLYFTTTRSDGVGKEDIFFSELKDGMYQAPKPLDTGVNSEAYEFNAYINPDEDLIIFGSYGRPYELGGGDLYFSTKDENGYWSMARNMGPLINSSKLDYCPFIDYPRGNFYFTSDRTIDENTIFLTIEDFIKDSNGLNNGMGNIYRIGLEQLKMDEFL